MDEFKFGIYRHYKGDLYTALAIVFHHETRSPMALYFSHAKGSVNVRPLRGWPSDPDGWFDKVTVKQIAGSPEIPRFKYMGPVA